MGVPVLGKSLLMLWRISGPIIRRGLEAKVFGVWSFLPEGFRLLDLGQIQSPKAK